MPGLEEEGYHQINGNANKAILQQLIEGCTEETTGEILKCYRVGASDSDIRKSLFAYRVPPLKKTAVYLKVETEGKKKADIISDIITRIESLLMELCGVCSEYYAVDLQDTPLYNCVLCHQGCHQSCYTDIHQTIQAMDSKFHKSLQFMCSSCLKTEEPAKDDSSVVKVKKSPTKSPVNPRDTTVRDEDEEEEEDAFEPSQPQHPSIDQDRTEDPMKIPICPAYKWGKCPDYETCEYRHPPRCWNWLESGRCSRNNKCRFHHPPICYQSMWHHQCLNLNCKYFHLTKTLRYKMEDEQLKSSLHAANYQSQYPLLPQQQQQSLQPQYNSNQPQQQQSQHPQHHLNQSHSGFNHRQQSNSNAQIPVQRARMPIPNSSYQQPQTNSDNRQDHSGLSRNDLSFLAQTIKESLKEDLIKEITNNIKEDLQKQFQTVNVQSAIPVNTMPQNQMPPFMFIKPHSQ